MTQKTAILTLPSLFFFCQTEALHAELISVGLIRTLAEMSRLSFGNANMPKICFQSLVRLIVTMEDDTAVRLHLEELLDYEIVPLIATYIRSGRGAFVAHG